MGTYEQPGLVLDKSMGQLAAGIKAGVDKGQAILKADQDRKAKLALAEAKEKARQEAKVKANLEKLKQKRIDNIADINGSIQRSYKPGATQGLISRKTVGNVTTVTSEQVDASDPSLSRDTEMGMQGLWVSTLEGMTDELEKIQFDTPEYKALEQDIKTLIELGGVGNQMMDKGVQIWEDSFMYDPTSKKLIRKPYASNGASIYGQDVMRENMAIAWSNGGKDPITGEQAVSYVVKGNKVGVKYVDPVIAKQQVGKKLGDPDYIDPDEYTFFQDYSQKIKGTNKYGTEFWQVADVDEFDKKLQRTWNQFDNGYSAEITRIQNLSGNQITTQTVKDYDKANEDLRARMTSDDAIKNLNMDPNTWQMIRRPGDPEKWEPTEELRTLAAERMADKCINTFGKPSVMNTTLKDARTKADQELKVQATVEGFAGLDTLPMYTSFFDNSPLKSRVNNSGIKFGESGYKYTVQELDKLSREISGGGAVGQTILVDVLNQSGGRGGMQQYISGSKLMQETADNFADEAIAGGVSVVDRNNMTRVEKEDIINWAINDIDPSTGNPRLSSGYQSLDPNKVYDKSNVKKAFDTQNDRNVLRILLDQFVTPTNAQKVLDMNPDPNSSDYIALQQAQDEFNAQEASQGFA